MIVDIQNARLAFPSLWETSEYMGKHSYKATFLIEPKSVSAGRVEAAIIAEATAKWPKQWKMIIDQLRAGNDPQKLAYYNGNGKANLDGYEGNMVLTASAAVGKRPTVVDRNRSPLIASDGRPYAGCYVNGRVEIWMQDNAFGKGIRATLLGVQFYADGDSFGAGSPPAAPEDFADLDADGEGEDPFA